MCLKIVQFVGYIIGHTRITLISTHHTELVERFKQLNDQVDILRCDIGVDQVEELRRFGYNVKRLHVVGLLA